jgi:hypothetical protein
MFQNCFSFFFVATFVFVAVAQSQSPQPNAACPVEILSFAPAGVSIHIRNTSGKAIVGLVFNAAVATEHWKWFHWDFDDTRPVRDFGWNKAIKPGAAKRLSWYWAATWILSRSAEALLCSPVLCMMTAQGGKIKARSMLASAFGLKTRNRHFERSSCHCVKASELDVSPQAKKARAGVPAPTKSENAFRRVPVRLRRSRANWSRLSACR